jgi:hypothetical protein
MQVRKGEAGEGALKMIFWLAVLAGVIVFVVRYVPVRIATAEFEDYMREQARFAQHSNPERLKTIILDKAVQLKLPIKKENCTVEKPGDRIRMECVYEVEVDFVVTTHTYRFNPQIDEPIFIF